MGFKKYRYRTGADYFVEVDNENKPLHAKDKALIKIGDLVAVKEQPAPAPAPEPVPEPAPEPVPAPEPEDKLVTVTLKERRKSNGIN